MKNDSIKVERIAGLPLIFNTLRELEIAEKIDTYYPSHGNWFGLSKGKVVEVWISYIISNCDHRLSHVSDWVSSLSLSLGILLEESIRPEDLTDDKLGNLASEFSNLENWKLFESSVNKSLLRVYDLSPKVIQLDPTVGKSFKSAVEGGLLQYGVSKHFRKDLTQFKTIVANLEECNIPLTSITVSGEKADDVLYIPAIKQSKLSIDKNGLLWVGDSKLASFKNRVYILDLKDYYLCPLGKLRPAQLLSNYLQVMLDKQAVAKPIYRNGEKIAEGYELSKEREYEGTKWTERCLVVKSIGYALSQEKSLKKRLNKAQTELEKLNKRGKGIKRYRTEEELAIKIDFIENHYKVKGLLKISKSISYQEKKVIGRKGNPNRIETKMDYKISIEVDEKAYVRALDVLGWRVYVTNQNKDTLSLEKAVNLYREEYKIERRIRNLKEEVTKLLPLFLKKDDRIEGLINLLMLILKIISAIEYKVAQELLKRKEELAGLYAGNPKITAAKPTISKMMNAFKDFSIVFIFNQGQLIQTIHSDLTPTQLKIIDLMELNIDIIKIKPLINRNKFST